MNEMGRCVETGTNGMRRRHWVQKAHRRKPRVGRRGIGSQKNEEQKGVDLVIGQTDTIPVDQIVTRGKEGREGRERHAGQKKGRVRVTPWPRKSLLRWPSGTQQGKPKREARWHDQSVGSLTGVQRTKDSAARSNRRMVAPRGTETGSPLVGRWGSPAAEAPPGSSNRWCLGCGCGGSRGG
jgi:hypothetical protein